MQGVGSRKLGERPSFEDAWPEEFAWGLVSPSFEHLPRPAKTFQHLQAHWEKDVILRSSPAESDRPCMSSIFRARMYADSFQ